MSAAVVNVAVAVVQRADGRVLLAERPHDKVSGGFWEFPGGKFDAGERAEQALARELHEEIGIELDAAHPWLTYEHTYTRKIVRLHVFRITAWHGTPRGHEGQRISWEDPAAVSVAPLLPANDKVLQALTLPSLYAITNAKKIGVGEFMSRLDLALLQGVRLIQVREPDLAPAQLAQFSRRVIARAHDFGAVVLINGDETLARKVGADGVHSPSRQLMRLTVRPRTDLWGASCHNTEELERAATLGADFVVLSPVLPTTTHPGVPGMGWQRFADLLHGYPLPVYALGGMQDDLLGTAIKNGAHGIARLSGIW
ncbi:MAG: Nudix family hydrolase [Sulfuricaulis sp.]